MNFRSQYRILRFGKYRNGAMENRKGRKHATTAAKDIRVTTPPFADPRRRRVDEGSIFKREDPPHAKILLHVFNQKLSRNIHKNNVMYFSMNIKTEKKIRARKVS